MAQLLTKTGVVKAIHGRMAVVVTKHEPACESCKAKDTCSLLGGTGANREVRARNTVEAQVGDIVTISIRSSSFLKVSFLVYMVPVLALAGGILIGYSLARLLSVSENLLVGAFSGLALVGSFWWLRKKANKLAERHEFVPEITTRHTSEGDILPADTACYVE
jgi:sigma-E factor negative regulatory protein RseC